MPQRELKTHNALISACLGVALLILGKLFMVAEAVSELGPRVSSLEVTVSTLYRASEARRDNASMLSRMRALEWRVAKLEDPSGLSPYAGRHQAEAGK